MPPGRQHSGGNFYKQQQQHQQRKNITNSSSAAAVTTIHTSNTSLNSSASSSNGSSSTPTNTMTRNIGPTMSAANPATNGNVAAMRAKGERPAKGGGGAPPGGPGVGGRRRGGGPWPDSYLAEDENFPSFRAQLAGMGLQLRDIPADGNCLFRALGDQLEGHCRNHFRHRAEVVNFMRLHRTDFEPFVEDEISFDDHVRNLQKLGTHAGNDAIVAFAKVNSVNVIIHQLNGKPLMIPGPSTSTEGTRQLHLAYHNGDHYSSVRRLGDNTESPAHIRLQETLDDRNSSFKKKSQDHQGVVSAKRGLEDIETEVALAARCDDKERVRQSLYECDYDVDAAIADLLQQMEMSGENGQDDSTSLASQQTSTDSGVWNSLPASASASTSNSNNSSPTSSNSRHGGSVLRNSSTSSTDGEGGGILNGHGGSVNGKGLKVHFREDSFGGNSSGYGSLSSNKGGGARPKVMVMPQQQVKMSAKKLKEMKKQEKKRKQEEKRREKHLGINNNNNNNMCSQQPYYIPQAADVRDVTVVPLHDGRMARI